MASSFFKLNYSLRYVPALGWNDTNTSAAFPVNNALQSKYVVAEQAFNLVANGLKPGTPHKAYLNGVDVTQYCKQEGKLLGEGLISTSPSKITPFKMPRSEIDFVFYYKPDIEADTPLKKAGMLSRLIGGAKVLTLISDDGKSKANLIINIPTYARTEPDVTIKKVPSLDSIGSRVSIVEAPKNSSEVYFTPDNYSLIQTFYADPDIVNGSGEVSLTSLDLYFKFKPNQTRNVSGDVEPGVSVSICEVSNDVPSISKTYVSSLTRKSYNDIFAYSDASTPVSFGFDQPIKLATGRFYGIIVSFEDPAYELWTNKSGDKLVGTNIPSPGVNTVKDGKLFFRNNTNVFNDTIDTDLKFNIKCAKFVSSTDTKVYVNKDYEFFTISGRSGSFLGGEYVYKDTTPETGRMNVVKGSVDVVGVSTNFDYSEGDKLIVYGNSSITDIVTVSQVVNTTFLTTTSPLPFSNSAAIFLHTPVGVVSYKDDINNKLYLVDSNADTTLGTFGVGNTVIGVDSRATANISSIDVLSVDRIKARANVKTGASSRVDMTMKFTSLNNGTYAYSDNNDENIKLNDIVVYNIKDYDAQILSRSLEVNNINLYSNTDLLAERKSWKAEITFTTDSTSGAIYASPSFEDGILDIYMMQNSTSNNNIVTNSRGDVIDSEVVGNGTAKSRHISTKVKFNDDRFAEDVKVFMTAYRPIGTDIKVYTRLYNSADMDAFDDKSWTPLEYTTNISNYSSPDDETDFIEYELGLPQYSESSNTLPGSFTSTYLGSTLVGNGVNPSSYVANNDIVKIYNSLIPENYQVVVVQEATNTSLLLSNEITSNNVVGSGFKVDRIKYPHVAFNDITNDNICKYYNSTLAAFDTFDTMQVKIVFVSDNSYITPKVDQVQVIGVSV